MTGKHLFIAGGGTGGHIAPAIAVGSVASDRCRVSYICTPRPVDTLMYSGVSNPVHVMNPPRIDRGRKLLLPFSALRAFLEVRSLLHSENADAVLGTGGYSSFFAIAAARSLGIPAALFDSNALPGRSNRLASKFCRIAFTGFEAANTGFKCTVVVTGTPVSGDLKKKDRLKAKKELGIPEDRTVLLFLGGSQGARAINDLALSLDEGFTVLLQCGERDSSRVLAESASRENIIAVPFKNDLTMWYSAADLAVARAGGQTIAELSAFRLPAVLIPFPFAAEDHQTANALAVEKAGGAVHCPQKKAETSDFAQLLIQLTGDTRRLASMEKSMAAMFPGNPAEKIITKLLELWS